jgi:hypothetical protein
MEYIESNSRAIVRSSSGVVHFLPVVLNEANEPFIKMFDRYVQPQDISGFERLEILPQFKKVE